MSVAENYLPVSSAYTGKSCTSCCQSPDSLLRCSSCKLVSYCTRGCQKADWPKHKVECKCLKILKEVYSSIPYSENERQGKAFAFLKTLPMSLMALAAEDPKRDLPTAAQLEKLDKDRFYKFVMYGRACSICLRNDFISGESGAQPDWKCCPDCSFGWCCSSEHWEEYQGQHTPEICSLYQRSTNMEHFHYQHAKNHNAMFLEMPEKGLKAAFNAFPKDWDEYFRARFPGMYPDVLPRFPQEYYPASTKLLSQSVTCLAAMYKFGISNFADKEELVIHVVGADTYELPATCIWEEISHCLPNVKTLTVHFIGPDAPIRELPSKPVISVCPECTVQGRQRYVGIFGYTYHDYAQKYLDTSKHSKPHLIVAFNTGIHEQDIQSWKTSLEVMLDMNVPAYFTSYCEQEAVQDLEVLRGVNANLLQEGPERNPFVEDSIEIECASEGRIDRFFANNMYGTLFQGRKKTD